MMKKAVSLKRERSEDERLSPPLAKRKQQSTTTQRAVANFFKPASEKEPLKLSWRTVDESLLVGRYRATSSKALSIGTNGKQKICAFDFDSTLISPASGNKFASHAADWKWWHGLVPKKLQQLHEDGYLLVILSNQGGISLKNYSKTAKIEMKRLTDFKRKVTAVFTQLDLPLSIYAATANDGFRKPRTRMWAELLRDFGLIESALVDLDNSVFVGDAGGRIALYDGPAKDFSSSDRDFAHNIGVPFKTPEEFFLDEKPRAFTRHFEPSAFLNIVAAEGFKNSPPPVFTKMHDLDVVLLCGRPGAGKSTFYWNYCKPAGYERVNQDTLKSRERCLQVAADLIKDRKPIVVDNTNADPETRAHWVQLAVKFNVPIRCVLFTANIKLCEHNDAVRALSSAEVGMNPEKRMLLPKVAFTSFAARYREPTLEEGFKDITRVEFRFHGTDEQKAVWARFWI